MSPQGARPTPPEPIRLRRHLEAASQSELEEFRRFWCPHEQNELPREALLEKLLRLMSDENVVYAKVELLSEKVRAVLFALLRAPGHTADLQSVFRGSEPLDLEYYEAEAALTALARRGFVRTRRARDWLHFGRSSYSIPQEMAQGMQGLAGTDRRPIEQVFLRSAFRPTGGGAQGDGDAARGEPGTVPASVADAIETLPTAALRDLAREVLERFGGILTRQELPSVFGERRARWDSARLLHEMGSRGLGTVGHLDLRARGIGVDDDALVFFHETVERYVAEWRTRPLVYDRVLAAHGDLMSDVSSALLQIQESPVRVGKEGSVYKAARGRIADRLIFPPQPLLEREDVAEMAIALVRDLGLAEDDGEGELLLTAEGLRWDKRPLLEKLRAAYDSVALGAGTTLRSHHLAKVHAHMVALFRMDPQGWWPGLSLAMLARNRYLLELGREEPVHRSPLAARPGALTELGLAAQDLLVRAFFALGLAEVAMRGQEAAGFRLTNLGRRLLFQEKPRRNGEAKPLVVNPDFEVLVLPEGDVDELLHELDRIAARSESGEVVHYRLDRQKIERATVGGETIDAILDRLRAQSRTPLPQNVEYSLRSWSEGARSAELHRGLLFESSDPKVVEAIANHPALRGLVKKLLPPNAVLFHGDANERQIAQELRLLGIYVK